MFFFSGCLCAWLFLHYSKHSHDVALILMCTLLSLFLAHSKVKGELVS